MAVIAIVGAGPGIALGVAQRFGREGFQVALLARRAEALAGYVAALAADGVAAHGFAADASDAAALQTALAQVTAQLGAPTVLVYNVAVMHPGAPTTLDPAALVADFATNVVGALIAAQHVVPAMREAGTGSILLTGGGLALYPNAAYASLAVGKAGMRSLAYTLGDELAPAGIHVATVTVCGSVQPGTHFDPALIAEKYWELHTQPRDQWQREIVYQ